MLNLCLRAVIAAVMAYFLGCFNGAVIISKYILRDDVRTHGSGNAGLTNFHRTFGGPLTAVVILCDALKMVVAAWLAVWILGGAYAPVGDILPESNTVLGLYPLPDGMSLWQYGQVFAKYWAGAWCVIGHMYPCMFGFRGGKGILSGGTLILLVDWRVALVGWGGFLLLTALTRWVSLGSIWAGASFPFSTWFVFHDWILVLLAVVVGGLIVWKHRGNLQRILRGEERKFSLHRKKDA